MSLLAFPCVFALLPDRKKSTYQRLFQELNGIALSIGRTWRPEQIMSDFEASLIPAVAAEVITIYHVLNVTISPFSFRTVYIKGVTFILISVFIVAFSLSV